MRKKRTTKRQAKKTVKKPAWRGRGAEKPVHKALKPAGRELTVAQAIKPRKNFDMASVKIKVFGVGGGGCTIVGEIANIVPKGKRISFVTANTDVQSLNALPKDIKRIVLGRSLTQGLGCGMNPEIGAQAGELSREEISREIENCDFCIFIATLGGGTGSGAMPLFAEMARDHKKLSLGIFTLPFKFEGDKRANIASQAFQKIKPHLSANIVIPNENIFKIIDSRTAIKQSFSAINRQLAQTITGLLETLYDPGLINIDFADFRTILDGAGRLAYQASVEGERREFPQMIERLLSNPLVEYGMLPDKEARALDIEKILFNITGPSDLKMSEVEEVSNAVTSSNLKAKIIFGILIKSDKNTRVRITLLAVGEEKGGFRLSGGFSGAPAKNHDKTPRKKPEKTKSPKEKIVPEMRPPKKEIIVRPVVRRNAIELKKEEEKAEKEILEQEQKWDIPTFLRIKKE